MTEQLYISLSPLRLKGSYLNSLIFFYYVESKIFPLTSPPAFHSSGTYLAR
jgi:hypothetical protein